MDKILALDASSHSCSVALKLNGEISALAKERKRSHHRLILPMINRLLSEAKLRPAELDLLICGTGPGSFVGLRIAVGVAQGLAQASGIQLAGMPSLAAVALAALDKFDKSDKSEPKLQSARILSFIDVKSDEVFWGLYEWESGQWQESIAPSLNKPAEISFDNNLPLLIAGGNPEHLSAIKHECLCSFSQVYPTAEYLLKLAQINPPEPLTNPGELVPVYLHSGLKNSN